MKAPLDQGTYSISSLTWFAERSQKIKALSRSLDVHAPARQGDPAPLSRNLDPALHPFDKPREYTRALNAAKLDRLFAKPFVGALEGHIDGIYSIAKDTNRLNVVASASGDGGKWFALLFLPPHKCLPLITVSSCICV